MSMARLLTSVERWPGLALAQPADEVLRDRETLPGDLGAFLRAAWHVLEPGRPYVGGWHVDAVCEHLEAVETGQITRLLINMPPRMTKSTTVSVAYPVWSWISDPTLRFLTISYAEKLALRDALKSRRLIQSPWFQERFGHLFQLTSDQNEKKRYENNRTGYRAAFSMGGGVMGEGGDRISIDDPQDLQGATSDTERASANETFDGAVSTRLNDPNRSAIILTQQRLHENDLTGHILAQDDPRWVHLMLPMEYDPARRCVTSLGWEDPREEEGELLCPARVNADALAGLKKTLGTSLNVAGQLQQAPQPAGGNLFKAAWFGRFQVGENDRVTLWPAGGGEAVQSRIVERFAIADTALSSKKAADPTVMGVFGRLDGNLGLAMLEEHRHRQEAPETRAMILERWRQGDLAYVGIESASAGLAFLQDLQRQRVAVRALKADADKVTRSTQAQVMAEAGQIFLPRMAPWVGPYIEEMEVFPNGSHDDRVDVTAYAAREFLRGRTPKVIRGAFA